MDLLTKKFLKDEFKELKDAFKKGNNVQDMTDHLACQFLEAGVTDFDVLLEMMSSECIFRHHDALISKGAKIDHDRMLKRLSPQLIANRLDLLLLWGCNADSLIDSMYTKDIEENVISLMANGASAEKLIGRLNEDGERAWLYWNRSLLETYYSEVDLIYSREILRLASAS